MSFGVAQSLDRRTRGYLAVEGELHGISGLGHRHRVGSWRAKAAANNPADFDLKMRMFNAPGETQPGVEKLSDDMTQMYGGS